MTTRIVLLRHGETTWNRDGNRYCGRTDVPLSDRGRKQGERVAAALAGTAIAAAYASPLRRSREMAEIVVRGRGVPVLVEPLFVEIDFGLWEGKTAAEIAREMPASWLSWHEDPTTAPAGETGETALQVFSRVRAGIDALALRHLDECIVVVGHNTANRLLIAGTLGMPFARYRQVVQDNGGISRIEVESGAGEGTMRWRTINERRHLSH